MGGLAAFFAAALLVLTSQAAAEAIDDCASAMVLAAQERVRVDEVIDGDTLRLSDGRTLRLVSALAPKSDPANADSVAVTEARETEAREQLARIASGADLALAYDGRRQDRHGRLLAHAFIDGDPARWLQGAMVEKGYARAYSLVDNYRCVRVLLRLEAAARNAGLGFWSTGSGLIFRADQPEKLAEEVGHFAIVEGRVLSVGARSRRTYLNFGTYWGNDFTVFVDRGDLPGFEKAGLALKGLDGRRVRVRGWIREDRGPAIHMTRPEQLELVDES